MKSIKLNTDLYRTLVLTFLAGLAAVTVALANRDVYSKQEVDQRIESTELITDVKYRSLKEDVAEIRDDVKWIIQNMGGRHNAETGSSGDSPQ